MSLVGYVTVSIGCCLLFVVVVVVVVCCCLLLFVVAVYVLCDSELPGQAWAGELFRHVACHQHGVGGGALAPGEALPGGGVVDEPAGEQLELLGRVGLHRARRQPQTVEVKGQAEGTVLDPTSCQLHPALGGREEERA